MALASRGGCRKKARKIAARAAVGGGAEISASFVGVVPLVGSFLSDLTTVVPRPIDGPVFRPVCATASALRGRLGPRPRVLAADDIHSSRVGEVVLSLCPA